MDPSLETRIAAPRTLKIGRNGDNRPLIARGCSLIGGVALIAMMTITVTEVVARSFFNYSFDMSEEYGGYLLVLITFISIPAAYAHSAFHQVEFIRKRLGERGQRWLALLFNLASLVVCLIIAVRLMQFELFSYRSGGVSQTSLATPLWIPQLAMPIGMLLLCWLLAVDIARTLWRELRPKSISAGGAPE